MTKAMSSSLVLNTPERFEHYFAARSSARSMCTVTPISSATFQARAQILTTSSVRIEHAKWSGIRVDGVVSVDGFTFVPFLQSSERNSVWKQPINPGDLAWTPPGSDRCANYPEPLEVVAVTVPVEDVLSKCDRRGLDVERSLLARERKVAAPFAACQQIAVDTLDILRAATETEGGLPEGTVHLAVDQLLNRFLETLAEVEDKTEQPNARFGSYLQLVRKVEGLLHERPGEVIAVNQAAEALGVSRNTLHRAFLEVVETSPGRYIRNWQLSRARQELLDCKYSSVTDCAIARGFFDVGRFAGYYSSLFSEMPSETLRCARGY